MAEKLTAEEKLNRQIDKIASEETSSCLKICAKNRKYPKDCITDGALELMVREILELENRVAKYEEL